MTREYEWWNDPLCACGEIKDAAGVLNCNECVQSSFADRMNREVKYKAKISQVKKETRIDDLIDRNYEVNRWGV